MVNCRVMTYFYKFERKEEMMNTEVKSGKNGDTGIISEEDLWVH